MSALPRDWAVIRLSALGDVVLTTGVLDYWRRTRGWRFTVITRSQLSPVLENHPAVERIVGIAPDELHGKAWAASAMRLSREMRGMGLLDLHGSLRSRLLRLFWRGPVRAYPKFGIERRLYRRLGLGLAGERLLALNVPQRYSLAVEASAPARELLRPVVRLRPEEIGAAEALLASIGLSGGEKPVALHPYATHALKAWPRERWQALASRLDAEGRPWIVVGSDKTPFSPDNPRDLTGKTGLRATCAVLSRCAALVTNDSGPMHLATAVGTPVVALFGPTAEAWGFYPSGERDRVLERALPCRPCSLHGKSVCRRDLECLRGIEAEDVLRALP